MWSLRGSMRSIGLHHRFYVLISLNILCHTHLLHLQRFSTHLTNINYKKQGGRKCLATITSSLRTNTTTIISSFRANPLVYTTMITAAPATTFSPLTSTGNGANDAFSATFATEKCI